MFQISPAIVSVTVKFLQHDQYVYKAINYSFQQLVFSKRFTQGCYLRELNGEAWSNHGSCDLKYVSLVLLTNIQDSQVWQKFHSSKK